MYTSSLYQRLARGAEARKTIHYKDKKDVKVETSPNKCHTVAEPLCAMSSHHSFIYLPPTEGGREKKNKQKRPSARPPLYNKKCGSQKAKLHDRAVIAHQRLLGGYINRRN